VATDWGKKRKHQRVLFTRKEKIKAVFSEMGTDNRFFATVLDLSLGGLSCSITDKDNLKLKKGGHLIVREIIDEKMLRIVMNTEIEIKWLISYEGLSNIGFGSQFMQLSDDAKPHLLKFIEDTLRKDLKKRQEQDSQAYAKERLE
jgi:hypothetical protein